MGAVAFPYGPTAGLDAGDKLLLMFDQPVKQLPVASKADLDALLYFDPSAWALDYTGQWLDLSMLLITVTRYVW